MYVRFPVVSYFSHGISAGLAFPKQHMCDRMRIRNAQVQHASTVVDVISLPYGGMHRLPGIHRLCRYARRCIWPLFLSLCLSRAHGIFRDRLCGKRLWRYTVRWWGVILPRSASAYHGSRIGSMRNWARYWVSASPPGSYSETAITFASSSACMRTSVVSASKVP